jgi:hypothetical protein
MLPLSLAATDEQCGWDSFGVALPVSRTKTVVARYITSIVVMLASELLVAAAQVISMIKGGTPMNFSQYMVITIFCLLLSALIIPIIYKFGVQKGRIIMMTICLVPSMLTVFLIVLMFRLSDEAFDNTIDTVTTTLEQTPVTAIILVAFIITVVLYALSMLLSISIYKKKDF